MNNNLKIKIASFPDSPGVYLMKDALGKIIYIGKAKSLRKRVGSYLVRDLSAKTLRLMANVMEIEFQLCASESMALMVEAGLIRQHKPKYNVALRDDKSFPLVKITNEKFPALYITRKREANGAKYLGPYTNAGLLREALKIIRRYFPYRSCKTLPKKACIYYRIKLSPAPCIGKITKSDYARSIRQISLILEGKSNALVKELTREMQAKAKEQDFEGAAVLRDKIIALSTFTPFETIEQPAKMMRFRTGFKPSSYSMQAVLDELKDVLRLPVLARRIEAFDVSNILGRQATASMVSFYNGLADKDNYRRFKIKAQETANDYNMLAEAIYRRYLRVKEENLPLPDLILVDGGKGQLAAAKRELELLGLSVPIISLAKREEEIYTLESPKPIRLKNDSIALRLLMRIRDESHRFALKYHHILRRKRMLNNEKS